MKTIFRFLSTGVLTAAIVAVAATVGFGQDAAATPSPSCADIDGHNALYTKFTGIYNKKVLADMESALSTGKEYLEKYGSCTEAFKEQIDFVKQQVPKLEKDIPAVKAREILAPYFKQFDEGLTAGNADAVLAAGKEILNVKKEDVNIAFAMALIAAEKSNATNKFKYSDDAIKYSTLVEAKLKSGWKFDRVYASGPKKGSSYIGIGDYNRADSDAAQAELNYTIAYQTFYGKKDMKAALPMYYALSQTTVAKDDPRIYQAIGQYFGSEVIRLNGEVAKLIAEQKAKATDDEKLAMEPKIKESIGVLNGTAERAMDFYSRAYKLAKTDTPAAKTYKDALYKDLSILYEGRFQKKDGLEAYIATATAKPVPDPTTPVTPVNDPEPATTTGTAAPATAAPASTTAAKPPTKPMSTTGTAKTPVVKKGTR
jgi:hypothetical protein